VTIVRGPQGRYVYNPNHKCIKINQGSNALTHFHAGVDASTGSSQITVMRRTRHLTTCSGYRIESQHGPLLPADDQRVAASEHCVDHRDECAHQTSQQQNRDVHTYNGCGEHDAANRAHAGVLGTWPCASTEARTSSCRREHEAGRCGEQHDSSNRPAAVLAAALCVHADLSHESHASCAHDASMNRCFQAQGQVMHSQQVAHTKREKDAHGMQQEDNGPGTGRLHEGHTAACQAAPDATGHCTICTTNQDQAERKSEDVANLDAHRRDHDHGGGNEYASASHCRAAEDHVFAPFRKDSGAQCGESTGVHGWSGSQHSGGAETHSAASNGEQRRCRGDAPRSDSALEGGALEQFECNITTRRKNRLSQDSSGCLQQHVQCSDCGHGECCIGSSHRLACLTDAQLQEKHAHSRTGNDSNFVQTAEVNGVCNGEQEQTGANGMAPSHGDCADRHECHCQGQASTRGPDAFHQTQVGHAQGCKCGDYDDGCACAEQMMRHIVYLPISGDMPDERLRETARCVKSMYVCMFTRMQDTYTCMIPNSQCMRTKLTSACQCQHAHSMIVQGVSRDALCSALLLPM
jgi:hypothetical protein